MNTHRITWFQATYFYMLNLNTLTRIRKKTRKIQMQNKRLNERKLQTNV